MTFVSFQRVYLSRRMVFFFIILVGSHYKHNIFSLMRNSTGGKMHTMHNNTHIPCTIFTRELRQWLSSHSFMHEISTLCIFQMLCCKQHFLGRSFICESFLCPIRIRYRLLFYKTHKSKQFWIKFIYFSNFQIHTIFDGFALLFCFSQGSMLVPARD